MDIELVLFVIVSFLATKIQGKAGIQYRISEESFNKGTNSVVSLIHPPDAGSGCEAHPYWSVRFDSLC